MATVTVTSSPTTLDTGSATTRLIVDNRGPAPVLLSNGTTVPVFQARQVAVTAGTALTATAPVSTVVNVDGQPAVALDADSSGHKDGSVTYPDLAASARSGLAASSEMTGTYAQLWATPAASTTLTGTLAAWTVTAVDCTAGAGARTLPLANSVPAKTEFNAKKGDTSSNKLVITASGSDKIYGTGTGSTTKTLTLSGEAATFVSDGVSKYTVRGADTPSAALAAIYPRSDLGVFVPAGWGQYWKAARDAAASTPAVVGVVGDSITQGFHCSDLMQKSWVSLIRNQLQTRYGNGGTGFFGSTFTVPAFAALVNWPASNSAPVTGTWNVKGGTEGPGSISIFSQNRAGDTITYTVTGTTVSVYYMTDPTFLLTFTVTIDGVSQGSLANNQAQAVRRQDYTVADGTHTVVLTTVGGSGLTCIFGCSGSRATGVTVNNFGYNGRASASYALASPTYGSSQSWSGGSNYPCDLYIYALGVNDANTGVVTDTYLSNIRRTLDSVRGAGTKHGKVDVLFLAQHIGTFDNATPLYHRYMLQMRGMAEAYGAAFVDMWAVGRNSWDYSNDLSYWGDGGADGLPGTNTVHPGDIGHQAIADVVLPILIG